MIDIYDGVLEEHNAILVDDAVKKISWKYDYSSEPSKPNKHWHVLCGHDESECTDNGYDWADYIFVCAKVHWNKLGELEYERIYCNAHTDGIEPHLHLDDGQFTMIYYPRLDWKQEWGGGTMVDGELVHYVGNRLVIFDAHLPHQAMPVSRECYELRTNVVFKCNVIDQAKKTIDFYKNAIGQGNYKIKFA